MKDRDYFSIRVQIDESETREIDLDMHSADKVVQIMEETYGGKTPEWYVVYLNKAQCLSKILLVEKDKLIDVDKINKVINREKEKAKHTT